MVFYNHYEKDLQQKGNPRLGWTYVLTIQDLAMVLPETPRQSTEKLVNIWNQHWSTLHTEQASKQAIDGGIDGVRMDILDLLSELQ